MYRVTKRDYGTISLEKNKPYQNKVVIIYNSEICVAFARYTITPIHLRFAMTNIKLYFYNTTMVNDESCRI